MSYISSMGVSIHYHWMILIGILFINPLVLDVHGYCAPGTDTTLEVVKPVNNQKLKVPTGGETTLQVRYNGKPQVRWYLNGKRIPLTTKSKHFEFIKGGAAFDQLGPILKIKDFKKITAGTYKVVIDNAGCINSKTIAVALDTSFSLKRSINNVLKKAPFLQTKVGITLVLLGFAFVFIVIPVMVCCAMCSKTRKLKKQLDTEKGKVEMYYDYEHKKKNHRSKSDHKKASAKERQALIKETSSSEDLPSARPHGKDSKSRGKSK